ncbi:ABC transporter ATP-binding protein [Microtetraspora malaysiensis]|uniref:ABC transporter ATP-binding protein n=1 Tax=Microtetraspora malaysiensis TaxID=161358 RepID=UPI0009FF87A0|nr:ABC transporter ATP-binding protein [Microtetraspora malaysiensis]
MIGRRRPVDDPCGNEDELDPLFGPHSELSGQLTSADKESRIRDAFFGLPRIVGHAFRIAWQISPTTVILLVLVQLCTGAMSATSLLAANSALVQLLQGPIDQERLRAAVPGVLLLCGAASLAGGMRVVQDFLLGRIGPAIGSVAGRMLLRSAVSSELASVDDPDFHNSMALAKTGSHNLETSFAHTMTVVGAACSLVAVSSALGHFHPLLFVLTCATAIPRGVSVVTAARRHYLSAVRWIENTRKLDLLSAVMTERDSAEEIRAHRIGDYLVESFTRLSERALGEQRRLAARGAVGALLGGSVSGVLTAATYGVLGFLVWTGGLSMANAATALVAIPSLSGNVTSFVMSINSIVEQALSIIEWDRACARMKDATRAQEQRPINRQVREVKAENLSFRYPGAERDALVGVNVKVACGEVVALVGANGSGKTTLAKVLAGLYAPSDGSLTWDGRPVDTFAGASLSEQVSLLGQGFVTWPFTVRANVAIGRPEGRWDDDAVDDALRKSGAGSLVARLRDGRHTLLALNFRNGVQLSGGQWQRIGLARVEYRDAPFVILDEPTAALDPEAEIEVFAHVAKAAARGKAVLLVTHRLASTRLANRIYVMSHGRIAESGTHEELIAANGSYARMYRLQAEQFNPA